MGPENKKVKNKQSVLGQKGGSTISESIREP